MKHKISFLVLIFAAGALLADDSKFSAHLAAKFQAKACLNCHDFFEKKLGGLSFKSHKGRTPEDCTACHTASVTGFHDEDEWFARTGIYTSGMTSKQICETVKAALHDKFKSKALLAKHMEKHLLEDPRVLWGIAGATPMSGNLPEGKRQKDLVKGGLAQWKAQVKAWINGGMKCN